MEYRWEKNENGEYSVKERKQKKNTALYIVILVLFVLLISMIIGSNILIRKVVSQDTLGAVINDLPKATVEVRDEGFLGLSEKVSESLVSIPQSSSGGGFFGFMTSSGGGSGLLVSSEGHIITTIGAVDGGNEVSVILPDGTEEIAEIISFDNRTGLVVLKVNKKGLTPCTFADSASLKSGMNVAAVMKNPVSSLGTTMSIGTVAGVNKNVALQGGGTVNLLQIDSSLTNSDGAVVFDKNGSVIGIITTSISSGNDNIQIAIPSNDILNIISSYTGEVQGNGLMIGISGVESEHGVVVETVTEKSSADKAGLKKGDLIMKIDGKTVKSVADINAIKEEHKKGDTLVFSVLRDGEIMEFSVKLG